MDNSSSTSKRIVGIVDDEIDITDLFSDALCQNIEGIYVQGFNDPNIAFEHFEENKENYALMISDLRMPGMNGLELLKKVKSSNPNVRTILMSAFNLEDNKLYEKYMKKRIIDSAFEKPITINRLRQRVRDELMVYELAIKLSRL